MFRYEELKTQPGKILALTSLTVAEFEELPSAFEKAYRNRYPGSKTKKGKGIYGFM